jgi:ATP/ADP translocase
VELKKKVNGARYEKKRQRKKEMGAIVSFQIAQPSPSLRCLHTVLLMLLNLTNKIWKQDVDVGLIRMDKPGKIGFRDVPAPILNHFEGGGKYRHI